MEHDDMSVAPGPPLITAEEYSTVVDIRAGRSVVLSREDYERLGGAQLLHQPVDPERVYERLIRARLSWRSRVMRDREIALFVIERASTEFLDDIREGIIEYFGEKRAPSRSALHRFLIHLRRIEKIGSIQQRSP